MGTYYGSTPLCFAASIGDAELMDMLTAYCRKLVLQGLESGWRPPVAGLFLFLGSRNVGCFVAGARSVLSGI